MISEKKENKILIYIISSFILIGGVIYNHILTALESNPYEMTIEYALNQITLFSIYSFITSLATISCITCYASTKKR